MEIEVFDDECEVSFTKEEVAEFALKHPGFGEPRALTFVYCREETSIIDVYGGVEGISEDGLQALSDHGGYQVPLKPWSTPTLRQQ